MEEVNLTGKALLVVDDENDLREIVASEFEFMGAVVFQAENISNAQKILNENKIDLIVSDIRMPGGTGIDLLKIVKDKNIHTPPVILITGFADITLEDAYHQGAEALLNKPFKLDDLIRITGHHLTDFEEKFKESVEGERVKEITSVREVFFGRGGMSVRFDAKGSRFDHGDVIRLSLKQFKGYGVCRWVKVSEKDSAFLMGIEFLNMDPEVLSWYKTLPEINKRPFIPSIS